ncbi:AAA family ATPase [Massilia sp. PAMC28688]|uniref:ATP-binding protein n=1 Tax=Massilia sp. PAMC28688 TaxID=2861283 RepID=UPI001C62B351|nr:AAA family ATPase [Massilia sp. PAMC28688]QYF93640.1 AAA family ATPase [Massilia sp. PAMC28688]
MIEALNGYAVTQRLRADGQFVLLRARRLADGMPVLLLGAQHGCRDSRERIEREYALRGQLDPGFAAMPLALADSDCGHVLVLADSGASPLQIAPGAAMTARDFLPLALAITRALAQLHERDLVHKDLRPEHILRDPASGGVLLTGFGSAVRVSPLVRGPERCPSASLAYMAPEQTGRVSHRIDARTDLYALGVVLYQLLCGELPFAAADAMQWIYCHVARAPRPLASGIDACCAGVVMKLLAKAPEQRYQSAAGLAADLARCLSLVRTDAPAARFPLGRSDRAPGAGAGTAFVGRADELALLGRTLRRAAAGLAAEPVLVTGAGGSGKSSLLAAFARQARSAGAEVMHVKFEQHLRDVPYGALRQDMVVRPGWRAALGADAGLLAHVLPGLGRRGRAPLSEAQAQACLPAAFRRLLGQCVAPGVPLLLCFDDLQWADPASLPLLIALLDGPPLPHVMVAGALRGLARAPVVMRAAQLLQERQVRAQRIALAPLSRAESGELVTRVLDCSATVCAPLADLVHARSGGNPMFMLQLLTRFAECGLLRHAGPGHGWQWDGPAIAAYQGAASLAELLRTRLQQLPYNSLELLKQLACLGQEASVATLARVAGMSEEEVDESLWPAARLGMLRRAPDHYGFLHDRIREAAATLVGRGQAQRCLHIGRVLAHGARGDAIFAAAGLLNRGQGAMDESEARSLVRINSAAGKRARELLAFEAARDYYRVAVALTPPASWTTRGATTFALHLALAECECLSGDTAMAQARLAQLEAYAAAQADPRLGHSLVGLRRSLAHAARPMLPAIMQQAQMPAAGGGPGPPPGKLRPFSVMHINN